MLPQYYHERACRLFRTIAARLEEEKRKQQQRREVSNVKQIPEISTQSEQSATLMEQNAAASSGL